MLIALRRFLLFVFFISVFLHSNASGVPGEELPPPSLDQNGPYCAPGGWIRVTGYGSNVTFFGWLRNGVAVPNSNNDSLFVTSGGAYTCVLTSGSIADTLDAINVIVYAAPNAAFTFSPNGGCGKTKVVFNNQSTAGSGNNITRYQWDFGDGGNSQQENPMHTYQAPNPGTGTRTYSVRLIVTNNRGCKDTVTSTISIGQGPDASLYDAFNFPEFTLCGTSTFELAVVNSSSTNSINTSYQINWGDGTSSIFTNMDSAFHAYPLQGYYNLQYIVSSATCKDTADYTVYIGTNPGVGLSSNGSTIFQCIPATDTFLISSAQTINNPPGTTYTVSFNDGSPNLVFTHPPPPYFIHTFTGSSCGATGGITPNTFYVRIRAENPCGFLDGSVEPITTVTKPTASFSIAPDTVICINETAIFTNTSLAGTTVNNQGVCDNQSFIAWAINSVTGTPNSWSVQGQLGSGNGASNGSQSIQVQFTSPGIYSIRLAVRNASASGTNCRSDTVIRTICVQTPPRPFIVRNDSTQCAPQIIKFKDSTVDLPQCGSVKRKWLVSKLSNTCSADSTRDYSYLLATDTFSLNPVIRFNNQGRYAIVLSVISGCGIAYSDTTFVNVKRRPKVNLNQPPPICAGDSIDPSLYNSQLSCGGTNNLYSWSFPGGLPAVFSSTSSASPPRVTYANSGNFQITFRVRNECGIDSNIKTIVVNPLPVISGNLSVCAGLTTSLSGSPAAATSTPWTSSNTTVATINSSGLVTGVSPGTAIITYTDINGCRKTATVTVNELPTVTGPQIICIGNSINLSGSASAASTNAWASDNTAIATVNASGQVTGVSAGTVNIIYTNSNGCRKSYSVQVKALPSITGLDNVCVGSNLNLSGSPAAATSNPWISSDQSVLSINSAGQATGLAPGTATVTYTDVNGCSNTRNITVNQLPQISGPVSVCVNASITLTGSGISATTNSWISLQTAVATVNSSGLVTGVAAGTANIQYTDNKGCKNTYPVTVNPLPIIIGPDRVCIGDSIQLTGNGSPAAGNAWQSSNPTVATVNNAGWVKGLTQGSAIITYEDANGCKRTKTINVFPVPGITVSGNNPSQCAINNGSIIINGLVPGSTYTLNYNAGTVAVGPLSITAASNGTYTISGLGDGSYTNITVTSNGCRSNPVDISLVAPSSPPAPTVSNDTLLCSGGTINLRASTNSQGNPTWNWSGPNGFTSTNQNPVINNATVSASGVYTVTVKINNCVSAASTVTVEVKQTPATPIAGSNSPVCTGNTLNLSASVAGNPTVDWSWTGPSGFSSSEQNPQVSDSATTAMAGTYTVIATAVYTLPSSISCPSAPGTTSVIVRPTPAIRDSFRTNPVNCASSTGSITLGGLSPNTSYQVNYVSSVSGATQITVSSNASGIVVINNLPAGTYSNIFVTLNNCPSASVGPFLLEDPAAPNPPEIVDDTLICTGGTINLRASTNVPGTATWSWTGPNSYTSSNQNPVITNATVAASGTYSVTVRINNCLSQPSTVIAEVKQTPATPVAGSNSPVCTGNAINLTASVAGNPPVDWSWTGPAGFSSNIQNPQVSNSATAAMAGTYTVRATAVYSLPSAISCPSSPTGTIVEIRPTPAISGSSKTDPVNCATATGTITLQGLTANATYQVSYDTSASGTVVRTISANTSGILIINNLPAGTYSNIFVSLDGCPSAPVGPFVLTDPNPPAAPVASNSSAVCTGETVNLAATTSETSATFTWSGPNNFSSTDQNPVINNASLADAGTYTVYITVSNCRSPNANTVVVVNGRPDPPLVTTPVVYCQFDDTDPLTATALPGHTLYWYTSSTGGTGSLTPPVPVSSTVTSTTYYVSQENPEECEGIRLPIVVVINPTPVIDDKNETICSGQTFNINPSGTGVPAGTVYEWSSPVVTGGLTGGSAATAQTNISGTLNNPTDDPHTATYTIIPQTGSCPGNNFEVIVTVNPAPRVEFNPGNQIICSGENTQAVSLSSPTANATISWTATNPAGINGNNIRSGSTTIPSQGLSNITTAPIVINYSALAVTSGLVGCPGSSSPYQITVNPTPLISDKSIVVCSGEAIDWQPVNNPPNEILPPATTYTWTFNDNLLVSGETDANVAQNSFTQQLINESNVSQTVVYTVTPQSGSSGDCIGETFDISVTINPVPQLPVYYDTICSENSFSISPVTGLNFSDTIVPSGTLYSWPLPQMPAGVSGGVAANNQSVIAGTLFNNTFVPLDVIYTVTPLSGDCPGDPFEVRITVNPLAAISNNPRSQSVCTDSLTQEVIWTSFTAGASYSWELGYTGNTTGALPSNNGTSLPVMQLTNSGIAQDSVVYEVTSTASACPGPPVNYVIYVNPDAKADFNYTVDTACWPFALSIQNISPNTANGSYDWYVDGNFIGSGYDFPGYTIPVSDTFADVRMVANSLYGCVNDTITHRFYTRNEPYPQFTAGFAQPPCAPLKVYFNNQTASNTPNPIRPFNYQWEFGNFATSDLEQPDSITFNGSWSYNDTTYMVILTVSNECIVKKDTMYVTVSSGPKALFAPDRTTVCSNTSVQFNNTSRGNGNTYTWNFGDGSPTVTTTSANPVFHLYNTGRDTTFFVTLTAENDCGLDRDTVAVNVTPSTIRLNWFIEASTQFGCAPHNVTLTNVSAGGNQFTWNFGDGSPSYTSLANNEIIRHTYANPGVYNITVSGTNGCTDTAGVKTVRVIRSPLPAFNIINNNSCPGTLVQFTNLTDTATAYTWTFGDPASGPRDTSNLMNPSHVYSEPGIYFVTLTATLQDNISGINCPAQIRIPVNVIAPAADITASPVGCIGEPVIFTPIVNSVAGLAPIRDTFWFINGVPHNIPAQHYPNFSHTFAQAGNYTVTLVVGTVNGCYDTVSTNISISSLPSINAGPDQWICRGNSVQLNAQASESNYLWLPDASLSCGNCPNPIATPLVNTTYVVTTQNDIGCTKKDSVLITVIQPFDITVSPDDTICINQSSTLSANGADNYTWNPSATLSCSTCPNPVATPSTTTTYTVTGTDDYNCFSRVRNVTVVVGQYPVVTLPADQVLSAGTLFNLSAQVTNGPVRQYSWTPARDLSCNDCADPVVEAKKDICYRLEVENIYGCRASDDFCIKVFCEKGQVYIPNAFTPGRAPNDRFWVRGKGIGLVKSFRVFNRWGEVVFEKYDYKPGESQSSFATRPPTDQGWDGTVRGRPADPDVYVYVVEVLCENETPFFFKGNVTLLR